MQTHHRLTIASLCFLFSVNALSANGNLKSWVAEILQCDRANKKSCATLNDALGPVEDRHSEVEVISVEEKDDKIIAWVIRSGVPFRYHLSNSGKVLSRECRAALPKEGSEFLDVARGKTQQVPSYLGPVESGESNPDNVLVVEDRCQGTRFEQLYWLYPLQEGRLGKPRSQKVRAIGCSFGTSSELPAIPVPPGLLKVVSAEGKVQLHVPDKLDSAGRPKKSAWPSLSSETIIQAGEVVDLGPNSSIVVSVAGLSIQWKSGSSSASFRFSTDPSLKTPWEQIEKIIQEKNVSGLEWLPPFMRLKDDLYELSARGARFSCHLEREKRVEFSGNLPVPSLATDKGVMLQTTYGLLVGRCASSR